MTTFGLRDVGRYRTTSDSTWLQSPSPTLVHGRYRNMTVDPGVSPVIVVVVLSVDDAGPHVLPPSIEDSHS